ncbi:35 kDa cyclophilin [Trypanosoma rangeli]|uniref:35 kDa cyclophilin n=1 Tax=Trypanosoma rangeli TaxID=5698 RepID=A0A3R7M7E5_TRYRA|nr:35 kDa cyclophilin [Trypanosoma rangeli]RNF10416.1 35 kDa cyclophilin [Trypanosoma rangeli]|eukprot:RNF10416.1 35 kDa cyclophilin [Trypanosoma rangeli]
MAPTRLTFTICGIINHPLFQQCCEAAEYLKKEYKDEFYVEIFREVPRDFHSRRQKMLDEGSIADGTMNVIVLRDGGMAMSGEAFLQMLQGQTHFRILNIPVEAANSYEKMACASWKCFLRERGNRYCWMLVSVDDVVRGRITFELYSQVVPNTCNNFWHLCRGDLGSVSADTDGEGEAQPLELTYKGSNFFRILHEAWVMGGDISRDHNGNGGYSCYGRYFPNESYAIPHDAPGVVGMCNDNEDTNASSFYITMKAMSWMNGRYVAFGRVIDGMDVVEAIHDVDVKHNQSPCKTITITDCGVIDLTDD